jgi:CRISPR-associated endonuclease/helicase Cas3
MDPAIWALWAKSDACGTPHSLVGHLLDAGAVAELIWDDFLAPQTQQLWNVAANNKGRDLLVLACVLHDIGKATPAFQIKDAALWQQVMDAGFEGHPGGSELNQRQHWRAGAWFAVGWLRQRAAGLEWLAPVIEGHHGRHEPHQSWASDHPNADGVGRWLEARLQIADYLMEQFSIDVGGLVGSRPAVATQLGFAGYVVMADWIASSQHFPGLATQPVTVLEARSRALTAWHRLGFAQGWKPQLLETTDPLTRFDLADPRPLQTLGVDVCQSMDAPGLAIVEAPMGEGKTEAGLAMAEVLAGRFGCNGVLFAMPTQGTTDAMYDRVVPWASAIARDVPVSLLHGKAMMNEAWRQRWAQGPRPDDNLDDYGMASVYGEESSQSTVLDPVPPQWVLGRHRGLLSHVAVATVDQVLYAATRTKFVSMRHAGLAGKVIIIDEVHSYDVYMSVFLEDLLKWCAEASVPVVLMSATLAPSLRARLVAAFRSGLSVAAHDQDVDGYPRVTTVTGSGLATCVTRPYRADTAVEVELVDDDPDDLIPIADRLDQESRAGGCVLVILDTVRRAQTLYGLLAARAVPTRLLHGRLTTATRADRTKELVDLLGDRRTRETGRPARLVVVATQIAEQSFDVDADLLVTDIAPMDLLLQRIGRLHRHQRPVSDRPPSMRMPRCLVLGVRRAAGTPTFARGPEVVYGRYALLKSVALIGDGVTWQIPSQVPALVAEAYDDEAFVPEAWAADVASSRDDEQAERSCRVGRAMTFRLTAQGGRRRQDLDGLHVLSAAGSEDEGRTVRDGDPTTEVALVVRVEDGYRALDGTPLGPNGERCCQLRVARLVWGDTVRLREEEWTKQLVPLSGWAGVPMVARLSTLVLDENLAARVPGATVTYDRELGLLIVRHGDGR